MEDLWKLALSKKDLLRFSVYVTASSVERYFSSEEGLGEASALLKSTGVTGIYLDLYRGGHRPGEELLKRARDYLTGEGFDVKCGITPTGAKGFGVCPEEQETRTNWWTCYSHDKTRRDVESVVRSGAKLFDELIIDDFFMTACRCPKCEESKGEGESWGEFRRRILADVLLKHIVRPGKEVNPNFRVIVKYPQYYDRMMDLGYDQDRETEIADGVWVGTETRDPETLDYGYTYQYQAYFHYRWMSSLAKGKLLGAWYDDIECYPAVYLEQAYQSILAGARDIILFCYFPDRFGPSDPNLSKLRERMSFLFELADSLDGTAPVGVHTYKPANADGGSEMFIFDYLGMLGLPLIPSAEFPEDARSLILTEHASSDPGIIRKMGRLLESGGTIIATPGLLKRLQHESEMTSMAGYHSYATGGVKTRVKVFSVDGRESAAENEIELVGDLNPDSAQILAYARKGELANPDSVNVSGRDIPVLTLNKTGGGKFFVLSARTFSRDDYLAEEYLNIPVLVSMIGLPQLLLDRLRLLALDTLGLKVESPSRVGVYPFTPGVLVLENFNDDCVTVKLSGYEAIGAAERKVTFQLGAGEVSGDLSEGLSVSIPPREIVLLKF